MTQLGVSLFGVPPKVVADHHAFADALRKLSILNAKDLTLFVDGYAEEDGGTGELLLRISDEYVAAQKAGDHPKMLLAQGRLVGIVDGTHESVWPAVLQETAELQVARFGNPATVVAALRKRMDDRANGHFNLTQLTPNDLLGMNDLEKLRLSVQLFFEIEHLSFAAIEEARRIGNDDIQALMALEQKLSAETKRLVALFVASRGENNSIGHLIIALKSASVQMPLSIASALKLIARGQVRDLAKYTLPQQHQLVGERGVQYSYSEKELATSLMNHFLRAHRPVEEGWEGTQWVLRFSKDEYDPQQTAVSPFLFSPWPPSPEHDIVLRVILGILGWKIDVDPTGDDLVVKVDFGANAI